MSSAPRTDNAPANARIILNVAKAIGAHLEMPELLAALNETLEPIIHFDAVGVSVVDGDLLKPYSAHIEGFPRKPGESLASFIKRFSPNIDHPLKHDVCEHPVSEMFASHKPYVATDLTTQRRFAYDETCFSNGFRSYISLPLLNNAGELFGDLIFLSKEEGSYPSERLDLLQSIAEIVSIAVANALAYEEIRQLKEQLQLENRALQEEIVQRSIYEEIVGSSGSLQRVVTAIEKVAPTDSTVLITGETGTGKELVAHAIHRRSERSARALVKVNCAALPAELIASELFGHEKGAFTGALQQRIGRFEAANGGTIFLDEIAELSPEIQVALLRVLQEREFERVGGNRTIKTDVRIITATNKDLEREVNDGRFRMDLFYRLNVFPIEVPPLRERVNDIPVLVDYFATRLAARMGKKVSQIEKRSLETMQQYSWPGNIRELQNVIERCVILAEGGVLRLEPGMLQSKAQPATDTELKEAINGSPDRKTQIEAVLRETNGRVYGPGGAAARLGLPASTLESRIRSLKINKHQFR
jgi:formate hydrogenlyase transcriptional activator